MSHYLRLVSFFLFFATVTARDTRTVTSDPSVTSTRTIVQKSFAYDPSEVAAGIFAGLYAILTFAILLRLLPNRTWRGLWLVIGTAFMSTGFVLRVILINYPNAYPVFVFSELSILLPPAALVVFNYILYGRFIISSIERRHSLIKPERIVMYFVISDITTFSIQGVGGSFTTSTNSHTKRTGLIIVLVGMSLQMVSFGLYSLFVCYTYRSLKRSGVKPFEEPWGRVLKLLFFSSAFFFLRCLYRTVELADALGSAYLASHEVFLYVFDSLPLVIGIVPYTIYWPSQYLRSSCAPSEGLRTPDSGETIALTVGNRHKPVGVAPA